MSPGSPLFLAAVIAAVAAAAFALDRWVPFFSRIGASLLAIILGAVLSNTGLVPAASPVYDAVTGPVTSLAIAWLLLAVNLGDLARAGGRMIGAFALAVAGTVAGAVAGAFLFAGFFGDSTWRLAGTLTGTYSGGSLNFVAVGRGLELPDALFAGATAADNLTTGLWLGATLLLPIWLRRFYPAAPASPPSAPPEEGGDPAAADPGGGTVGAGTEEHAHHPFFARHGVSTLDLALLAAVGAFLVVASEMAGVLLPAVPSVLWLTTLALVVGHLPFFRDLRGALPLGILALHLFFVVIGIHSRFAEIARVGVEVFLYTLVVVGVHGVVLFGGGRLLGFDVGSLAVASQAAVGGPSTALAVAVSRQWRALVLPGVIVGLLGYAIGNYLGFLVGHLVRGMGVGL